MKNQIKVIIATIIAMVVFYLVEMYCNEVVITIIVTIGGIVKIFFALKDTKKNLQAILIVDTEGKSHLTRFIIQNKEWEAQVVPELQNFCLENKITEDGIFSDQRIKFNTEKLTLWSESKDMKLWVVAAKLHHPFTKEVKLLDANSKQQFITIDQNALL